MADTFINPPEPDTIARALSCIPPDALTRDERAMIGFALFDAIGPTGDGLFVPWIQRRDGVSEAEAKSDWKSCCKPGKVRVGTLFTLAKKHGFRMTADEVRHRKGEATKGASSGPGQDVKARQAQAAADAQARERLAAEQAHKAQVAAAEAAKLWASGKPCEGQRAPYLKRKGIKAHGVRVLPGGNLLVPMHDAAGELVNVQTIMAKPNHFGTGKLFVKGAIKSGTFHCIGDARPDAEWMLMAEGYATAAACHEATGRPAVVAFDAGNLHHVCRALRQRWPNVRIMVCGDDDKATEAKSGKNAGRIGAAKAQAAASAVWCVFPSGLPDDGTDFNDLQAHAGPDEVCRQIEAAMLSAASDAPCVTVDADSTTNATNTTDSAPQTSQNEPQGDDEGKPGQGTDTSQKTPPAKRKPRRRGGGEGPGPDEGDSPTAERFNVNDEGVWYSPPIDGDGEPRKPARVCGRLDVAARALDSLDGGACLLLHVIVDGRARPLMLPMSALAGDGTACRVELLNIGFEVPADPYRRRLLSAYLMGNRTTERVRLVDRIGWHGRSFVMPTTTIRPDKGPADDEGDEGERYVFHAEGAQVEARFEQKGTVAQWNKHVGALCVGNSRIAFATACALAGPLLRMAPSVGGGGFHFVGPSSRGKTTALRVAASVWGSPTYMQNWRSTDNGLESLAAQHSDGTLILDEIRQIEGRPLAEAVYMLGNGSGKLRSDRNGRARVRLQWLTLILSTGEISVSEQIGSAGIAAHAGQELRLIDIPAEPSEGHGVFECLHGRPGGTELSDALQTAVRKLYGSVGRRWIEHLVNHLDDVAQQIKERLPGMVEHLIPAGADGQVRRAAARFALAALAGELATEAGIIEWPAGEATRAASRVCDSWLETRPAGSGASEEAKAIQQVRQWLGTHGDARFEEWHRGTDDHAPRVMYRAGWRRSDVTSKNESGVEWCVLVDTFNVEICKGLNPREVLRVLLARGHLIPESGTGMKRSRLEPPGHGKASVYRIHSSILDDAEDAA